MEDMFLYEYAVVRYVPAVEREEFINIGLIMMCKRRKWIRIVIHIDENKLSAYRCPHTTDEIRAQLDGFIMVCEGSNDGGSLAQLPVEERFRWITAVRSTCLATSRPHPGKTHDLDKEFDHIFESLVL